MSKAANGSAADSCCADFNMGAKSRVVVVHIGCRMNICMAGRKSARLRHGNLLADVVLGARGCNSRLRGPKMHVLYSYHATELQSPDSAVAIC